MENSSQTSFDAVREAVPQGVTDTAQRRLLSPFSWRQISVAAVLLACMVIPAELLGKTEIVFPEFATLCVGVLIYEVPRWRVRPWHILVFPSLGAWFGVALVASHIALALAWPIALGVGVIGLRVGKSYMGPTISAIVLPAVLGTSSVLYPIAVMVLCTALAIVVTQDVAGPPRDPDAQSIPYPTVAAGIGYWATIGAIAIVANLSGLPWFVLPPMAAACYATVPALRRDAWRRGAGLALGLIVGSIVHVLVNNLVIDIAISCIVVMVLLQLFSLQIAPAFALAVLPVHIPAGALAQFTITGSIGCVVCVMAMWWCAPRIAARVARRQRVMGWVTEGE